MADRENGWRGVAGALDDAAGEVLPPEPVQLSLLDALAVRRVHPIGTMGAIVPAPDDDGEGDAASVDGAGRRGAGRPPGARNKSTEALRRYIFANYGNPLLNAARFASADPVELARYLGCEPREALSLILLAARIVAEYVASKMPATVRLDGKGAMAFGMFTGPAPAGGEAQVPTADPLQALLTYAKQYQGVSRDNAAQSSDGQSSAETKETNGTTT